MGTCFVIQPFDKGAYDDRYEQTIAPAIRAAGLEPYRVDEDPAASILIDDIERGIREATLCLADISEDNPNIWYELGFAIASRKEVILLCSEGRRSNFPFDIHHRNILIYKTQSPRDFDALKDGIASRITALLKKEGRLAQVTSPLVEVKGLSQHEVVALVSIAENLDGPADTVATYPIRQDMERAGFNKVATYIALSALHQKGLVDSAEESDWNHNNYTLYTITEHGREWLTANQDLLILREDSPDESSTDSQTDDDIPF